MPLRVFSAHTRLDSHQDHHGNMGSLSHGGLGFSPVCLTNQAMVFQDWHLGQARFV